MASATFDIKYNILIYKIRAYIYIGYIWVLLNLFKIEIDSCELPKPYFKFIRFNVKMFLRKRTHTYNNYLLAL